MIERASTDDGPNRNELDEFHFHLAVQWLDAIEVACSMRRLA